MSSSSNTLKGGGLCSAQDFSERVAAQSHALDEFAFPTLSVMDHFVYVHGPEAMCMGR